LREFTFGHANQLAAVARGHLVALAARTPLLPGIEQRAFLDIDSLLRPVYGHKKQGASFGHAKIASRALLRLGLSPQITTISTATSAPVVAEAGCAAARPAPGAPPPLRSNRPSPLPAGVGPAARSCCAATRCSAPRKCRHLLDEDVEFSLSLTRNTRITRAIAAIDEAAYTPRAVLGAQHFNEAHEVIAEQSLVALGAASLSIRPRGLRPTRLRAVDSECDDDGPRP
jgi:hypothetical protein